VTSRASPFQGPRSQSCSARNQRGRPSWLFWDGARPRLDRNAGTHFSIHRPTHLQLLVIRMPTKSRWLGTKRRDGFMGSGSARSGSGSWGKKSSYSSSTSATPVMPDLLDEESMSRITDPRTFPTIRVALGGRQPSRWTDAGCNRRSQTRTSSVDPSVSDPSSAGSEFESRGRTK
jgi:hypothetical protein